ncbi:endothelin-converting enzyme homolog isoform X4 [Ixodes scapularis]|uniref:endothelin-converting enzyme homolog isoform X4 n=1 Tax=Ixodes scapularis TaxID=6945 RepID=UPI001C395B8C|nr:endothelin-converting enzyme homolog isoform X4 [Ixodes scapularis]
MTSSPTSSEPRRKSSVSPVISSYVLAPETPAAELRKESGPTTRYIGTGSGSPLVHHYRLASSDNPLRMRRSASVRANSNPRPVLLDSSVSSRDAEVPTVASQDASGHRRLEYRLFLLAMSSVTLMVALLQPLLLYRSLVPCTEPRCFSVALPVREALQASVSPCADFFRYSCSGIDSGFSEKVRHSLRLSTLSLISELPASPGQSAVRKAGILLRSCLRLVNQKPEDIDGIRHVLKIGGLRFPALPQTSTSSVLRGVVDLNLHLGIAVLFRLTVGRDLKHRGHHMLYLARNDDLAGFVRYLGRLEASQSLDDYVRRCAEVIGERGMSYARLIDAVRQTNRRFVLTLDDVVDGGPVFYAPPTQVGAFWTGIFKGLQSEFRNLPNVSKELFVLHSNYFNALDEIFLQQLEPRLLSAYVGLYVVWYLSRLGSHSLAYHISVQGYTSGLKDVWTRCFSDVYRLMPLAIERLYLEGHLKADDVHEMEDMLRRITHATGVFLASLDRNTGRLQTRLASLGLFAFGAQSTRALGDVDRLYDHVPDQRDEAFLDGFLNASRSTAQHARHLLRIPAEAQGGPFLPPFLAELPHMAGVHHLIPLGPDAVTPPAFTFDQSPTLNYAGLGGRIGAQVKRLLLSKPRLLNESGLYERVWSTGLVNAMRERIQCLRSRFLSYRWESQHVGDDLIRTAIVTHIVYTAFSSVLESPSDSGRFLSESQRFGMSPEQLFFVGSCLNWCRDLGALDGGRPAARVRVRDKCRFSLMVLGSFARAFGCSRKAGVEDCLNGGRQDDGTVLADTTTSPF